MKKNPTYFYANSTSYYPENRRYPCNCRNTNQNSDIEIMNVHITPMYAQGPTPRNYFPIPPGPIQGPTPPTNPPITVPITTESH